MPRFFINHPDIKPRAQSQQILVAWYVILHCILLITIFHSCSLVFNCKAVQCSCSICGHSSSLMFSGIPFVFTSLPFVFTCVPFVFTPVPFVFTRVNLCSLVFRLMWSFSDTSEHEWNTSEHEWNTSEHEWNTGEHEWTRVTTNVTRELNCSYTIEHERTRMEYGN